MVERDTRPRGDRFERIWSVVASIPRGCVATYGQIADLAGFPRAARFAGAALRRAPRDRSLPWHRVINARGRIAFPEDSASWRTQKQRLEAEGITFLNGRVDLRRYRWRPSLDEYLWKPGN